MGSVERHKQIRAYRGLMPSPGRPSVAWREDRVRFWTAIARGAKTEDACSAAGVSGPVGFRWFRHAGGVNPCLADEVSGRYLSFPEQEDIAVWHAQGGCGSIPCGAIRPPLEIRQRHEQEHALAA